MTDTTTESKAGKRSKAASNGSGSTAATKASVSVMVGMPTELKDMVDAEAQKATGGNTARWVRELIARTFNFTLPDIAPRGRASKYAHITDPALRKQAREQDQANEQARVRAVMKALRTGELKIDNIEDLVARLGQPAFTKKKKEVTA